MSREFDRQRPVGPERELARTISLLVDQPDDVHIAHYRQRGSTSFKVRVAQEDLGKLIGRQGRTARALRALLDLRGEVDGQRYSLEIRQS